MAIEIEGSGPCGQYAVIAVVTNANGSEAHQSWKPTSLWEPSQNGIAAE